MKFKKVKGNRGVNALSGLFSFLHEFLNDHKIRFIVCQRPKRALFISTSKNVRRMRKQTGCVNALNGLFSFLPK